ncbi:phosphoglycerate dehydrogenase [Streptomyces iconiensis]|uniref:Phosphoglycerate dehydrogenase n=1 Tax=Streptomyces iconiensis TaxID=1384038 RepID=A0ABT7A0J9_9ACTN|nr:phosphoglycerate dehydrogenase [Streptomyces iconiensis]MDJ1134855.1 phosphoglycerate dehydrogenase [Streptomyces iconiensis]
MTNKRVLVTTAYLEPGGEVDQLLGGAGLDTVFARAVDRNASGHSLREAVEHAEAGRGLVAGIVAGTDPFTAEVIGAAPGLRVIGRCGAGYDNVDVAAATRNGVAVAHTPGVNRQSVAEHVLGLMVSCARGIPQNVADVRAGGWSQPSGREVAGATLGVVGLGSIGRTVARLGQALGMRVVGYDPWLDHAFLDETGTRALPLAEVLAESDFVTLHLALDDSSRHLIDATALSMMKPGAYLINTSRGGVVDEEALAGALARGQLAGAALDVTEHEPLPQDSRLRDFGNVLVTGHIAGATVEARSRSSLSAARQVLDVLRGRAPAHLVNPGHATARVEAN